MLLSYEPFGSAEFLDRTDPLSRPPGPISDPLCGFRCTLLGLSETREILLSAQAGDGAALDELLGRHQGRLLAFLHFAVGQDLQLFFQPEDVLQETLLEAAKKVPGFEDRGPASFYRWLVAIARFKVLEARRAIRAGKRAAARPMSREPVGSLTSPSQRAMRGERAAQIRDVIHELPAHQARAVRLRYLEGRTVAETAAELKRTEGAVKMLVSRALDGLATGLARQTS